MRPSIHGGSDITLTRKNIDAEQARRIKAEKPLGTAEEIVGLFIACPTPRHYGRAYRLGLVKKD